MTSDLKGDCMRSLLMFGHDKAVWLLVSVITALTALGALPGHAAQ